MRRWPKFRLVPKVHLVLLVLTELSLSYYDKMHKTIGWLIYLAPSWLANLILKKTDFRRSFTKSHFTNHDIYQELMQGLQGIFCRPARQVSPAG